jgi:hypothetical protein
MSTHCDRNYTCARGEDLCKIVEDMQGMSIVCACQFCSDECKFRDTLGGDPKHPYFIICKCPERKRLIKQIASYKIERKIK